MKQKRNRILLLLAVLILVLTTTIVVLFFTDASVNNETITVRVRKSWTLEKMVDELDKEIRFKNKARFLFFCKKMGYTQVKPCFLKLDGTEGVYQIISKLKSARFQTVNVVVNSGYYTWDNLIKNILAKLEIDSAELRSFIADSVVLKKYNIKPATLATILIPNTYNMEINTNVQEFFDRMHSEAQKFWNVERRKKAQQQGLTPDQVAIIASVVTQESLKKDEHEKIAGVYLNRLRKKMKLQADPTIVFANGGRGKIFMSDLKRNHPYNTYLNLGLPPGPITIPAISAMEAVLNYSQHSYLFFCAREDFSGYHNFAETNQEHEKNAQKWRAALKELEARKKQK